MSNIINGTATDYEMPAKNYVNGTDQETTESNYVTETDYKIPTNDLTISADEHNAIMQAANVDEGAENVPQDKYEYADRRGRNHEYYPDPTYHGAKNSDDNRGYYPRYQRRGGGVPMYFSTKSKRHELIGCITRMCDLAGFDIVERIVLKDRETGEILR